MQSVSNDSGWLPRVNGLGGGGAIPANAVQTSASSRLGTGADTDQCLLVRYGHAGDRYYSTAEELIADPEKTAPMRLPHQLHVPVAKDTIAVGNVRIEQPIVVTVAKYEQRMDAAKKRGVTMGAHRDHRIFDSATVLDAPGDLS